MRIKDNLEQLSLFGSVEEHRDERKVSLDHPRTTAAQGNPSLFEISAAMTEDAKSSAKAESEKGLSLNSVTSLDDLRPLVLSCHGCDLRKGATNIVFGEGNSKAKVMFVGEGPGATEDATGKPFVGRAGQLLDLMLKSIGLERKDVFIGNIVKCRPPGNRLPLPSEVEACLPYLEAQMRLIGPRIVVLLGALSSQTLIDPGIRVTRDRGKWFQKDGIDYLLTFHPAAVLRDEPGKKRLMWEDFQSLKARLDKQQDV